MSSHPGANPARAGTQAVERALDLLHLISAEAGRALPLSRLSRSAGLDPGTTRRLLLALMRKGFVAQDGATGQYHLGLDFFSVAAAAANRFDPGEKRRAALRDLSRRAGTAAALFLREDSDMICVDIVQHTEVPGLGIGARRPIGAEAFGLALLAALPDEEGEAIVIRNVRRYSRTPEVAIRQVGERMRAARGCGYSSVIEPFDHAWSLAAAMTNRDGRAEAAIGIIASERSSEDIKSIAQVVMHAAHRLQIEMWQLPPHQRIIRQGDIIEELHFTM